ncbi:PstC, partial [Streptococcus thermophilus CNCM I-1630]
FSTNYWFSSRGSLCCITWLNRVRIPSGAHFFYLLNVYHPCPFGHTCISTGHVIIGSYSALGATRWQNNLAWTLNAANPGFFTAVNLWYGPVPLVRALCRFRWFGWKFPQVISLTVL